jgi:hypothetical protein
MRQRVERRDFLGGCFVATREGDDVFFFFFFFFFFSVDFLERYPCEQEKEATGGADNFPNALVFQSRRGQTKRRV